MKEKNITKKQHYVPQVYLRGFSEDKKRVWSYSLDPIDRGTHVTTESVCRENYLYEIRGEDGDFIAPNWIEKNLSELERSFAEKMCDFNKKVIFNENYQTNCFLNSDEKLFWKVFIAVQMMRNPIILKITQDVANDYIGDQFSNNQVHAFAVSQCLPFFSKLNPDDKNVFNIFLKPLYDMSLAIGVDEKDTLFTSDNPVYCYSSKIKNNPQIIEYDNIIMPLSSNLVLQLFGGKSSKHCGKNRLLKLNDEDQNNIKLAVAYSARKRVFSKGKLSEKDINIIKQARKDREKDELDQIH